jgi:hypothetical protein
MQVKSLESGHEIIGDLSEVVKLEDGIKLVFVINREILVPASVFSEKELKKYTGDRVGIIHIDGIYRIRRISPHYKRNEINKGETYEKNKRKQKNISSTI